MTNKEPPFELEFYETVDGDRKILILHGYDKGEHPSKRYESEQIEVARKRLVDFLARR